MFLWAHLVVQELRSCYSDWDLEQTAKRLLRGLEAAYGRILDRIMMEKAAPFAIRILGWLASLYRLLKVYELLDGLSFRHSNTKFERWPRMKTDILDLCRPLIEDGPSGTLDVVHFSATELVPTDFNVLTNCLLIYIRFIFTDNSRHGNPFLKSKAHFCINFSCVAYLNTSRCLPPGYSTEEGRAAQIFTGLHGLLPYANQFWVDHLLAYFGAEWDQQSQIPRALSAQLALLVEFQKPLTVAGQVDDFTGVDFCDAIAQLPQLKALNSNIQRFRHQNKLADISNDYEKSAGDLSFEACNSDPTYFSKLRHHYQSTLEFLLHEVEGSLRQSTERHFAIL